MSLTIRDDRHRNVGEEGQVPLGGSEASKNWEAHVLNIPCNVDLKILGSELEVKKIPTPHIIQKLVLISNKKQVINEGSFCTIDSVTLDGHHSVVLCYYPRKQVSEGKCASTQFLLQVDSLLDICKNANRTWCDFFTRHVAQFLVATLPSQQIDYWDFLRVYEIIM